MNIPTITDMQAAKRAGTTVTVRTPSGKSVTLGQYLAGWRTVRAAPDGQTFAGWDDFPARSSDIRRDYAAGVVDRINLRGGCSPRPLNGERLHRIMRMRINTACRWCGQKLGRYAPPHAAFCDGDCARAHRGA